MVQSLMVEVSKFRSLGLEGLGVGMYAFWGF